MINNNNFYEEFNNIFLKLNIENSDKTNAIYNEFIELYDYHINNVNKNLEDDLEIKTFSINEDGVLVS
jgi:hypothetical protein